MTSTSALSVVVMSLLVSKGSKASRNPTNRAPTNHQTRTDTTAKTHTTKHPQNTIVHHQRAIAHPDDENPKTAISYEPVGWLL